MDGDARGGAALSVREVSGAPIKFIGTGETMAALQPFYPERMTSRILGMGDVVTLVERAQRAVADSDAQAMQARMLDAQFDFNDFLKQAEMVANMGSMSSLMRMMPGMQKLSDKQLAEAENSFKVSKSLVMSMTAEERVKPELLAASVSRRRRIARGAGRTDAEMVTLIELFAGMRSRMQDMGRLMKIAGGKVGQMSEDEMNALVGAKKRVQPGMARRKRDLAQRKLASVEAVKAAEAAAVVAAEAAAQAAAAAVVEERAAVAA
jgi:signal recognition particle subunit SRP54